MATDDLPRADPHDEFTPMARERLSAIVDSCDDAIVSKDLNGIITSWNAAAERMFGYPAAEAIGRSIMLIVPADRAAEEAAVLAGIREGRATKMAETVRVRKDGSEIPIALTVSPIRDASGRVIGASKIARDIREQQRVMRALVAAERGQRDLQERLRLMLEASGALLGGATIDAVLESALRLARDLIAADAGAVWRLDRAAAGWRIWSSSGLSPEFCRRLVRERDDRPVATLTFDSPQPIESVNDAPMVEHERAAYEREGIRSMLVTPLTVSGQASATLVWYYRMPKQFSESDLHAAGAIGHLIAAALTTAELHDEHRQAEAHQRFLAESGMALASSLDYTATVRRVASLAVEHRADWCTICVVDENGQIEQVAIAHADPSKLLAAERLQALYPHDSVSSRAIMRVIETGEPALLPDITPEMLAAAARDARHLELLMELGLRLYMCVPLRARGRVLGAVAFVSDREGRRYGASDLLFAEDIGFRAALAIDNARAYRQAHEANVAKDHFLALLSHELRNPLNAMLGWCALLKTRRLSAADEAHAVDVIERNALLQLRLVEDLLDDARIVAGKLTLELKPIHVEAVVRESVDAARPVAESKNLTIDADLSAGDVLVNADAGRLQQAVGNLLSNALKFTPRHGQVRVRVAVEAAHVEIQVSDSGVGIPAAELPFIFDRFRQVENSTNARGLGLGLAIVREIVKGHDGTVSATSDGDGKGSTFRIVLPILTAT